MEGDDEVFYFFRACGEKFEDPPTLFEKQRDNKQTNWYWYLQLVSTSTLLVGAVNCEQCSSQSTSSCFPCPLAALLGFVGLGVWYP